MFFMINFLKKQMVIKKNSAYDYINLDALFALFGLFAFLI